MDALKYERKQKFKDVTYEIESNSQEKLLLQKNQENPHKEQKKRNEKVGGDKHGHYNNNIKRRVNI